MYKMMTPGPTMVPETVMEARSRVFGNPDVDTDFVEQYASVCGHISELLNTENETYILDGEGILGLEAACASLTEPVTECLSSIMVFSEKDLLIL